MEQQLIALYLQVCRAYDTEPDLKYQRLSNFRPRFTDEELVTVYLFGHMQGFSQQRRIYDYIRRHWRAWFPCLPSYQAFNRRLNSLAPAFEHLITEALARPVTALAAAARTGERDPLYPLLVPDVVRAQMQSGIGFGLAAAGAVVGSLTGVLALSRGSSVQNAGDGLVCPRSVDGDLSSGRTLATVSTIAPCGRPISPSDGRSRSRMTPSARVKSPNSANEATRCRASAWAEA